MAATATKESRAVISAADSAIGTTAYGRNFNEADVIRQFRDAIVNAGLPAPDSIVADGRLHRFATNGRAGDKAGWYCLHLDGWPAGAFGDWRSGISETWRAELGRDPTPKDRELLRRRYEEIQRQREEQERLIRTQAAELAKRIWAEAKPAPAEHAYLRQKGIWPRGIKIIDGRLVVPVLNADGEIQSLQFISPDGEKRFLSGGKTAGGYFLIGNEPKPDGRLLICEGYATGVSLFEATGLPTVIAFNAGNLLSVSKVWSEKLPGAKIIVCADDDWRTTGNPGRVKALEAAKSVNGEICFPVFHGERPDWATDFNDLARLEGDDAVRKCVESAAPPETQDAAGEASDWPEPQPLTAKVEPEPYPLNALPGTIRAAVEEVAAFVKAPIPLVAASALSAVSLACQSHFDVQRAEKLRGPVGLFLLTTADSGERKSTCDQFFTSAIREFEAEQAELSKSAMKEYRAALAAWEAERDGILSALREASRKGKPADDLRVRLAELERDKPEPPRVPRLILNDETPESLAWNLSQRWPSAGVLSAEAGTVLGAHAMGKDSILRNLALYNTLWDGGAHAVGRRTSESYVVRGARLTVGLQVQEPALREFFERSGPLARGTGFLARFLVSWPESTQGTRMFSDPPKHWPHLAAFNRRIADILNRPVPITEDGALNPEVLEFTPEAKAAWVRYHDTIEGLLANGRELYDVRDVASKSAENAARLAALFHVFEGGVGPIPLEPFQRAAEIAAWHLSEARRFFGELALPVELAEAARLDSWLIERCQKERTSIVKKNDARQYGPIRNGARLEAAIRELEQLDRVRLIKDGKRLFLNINPVLVLGAKA